MKLVISKDELKEGVNFFKDNSIIVTFVGGEINAFKNNCKHMKGKFYHDKDSNLLACPMHGWKLDPGKLCYVHPRGVRHDIDLKVAVVGDQIIIEELPSAPYWGDESSDKIPLAKKEFGVSFRNHACVKINYGEKTFFTDPWMVGPAFLRGWWLLYRAIEGWENEIAFSSGIYISHSHSDHLHEKTLSIIAQKNPMVSIFIPKFSNETCLELCKRVGLKNITIVAFNEWVILDENTKFMILHDKAGRDDSGLLFDYKGYRILSNVDCMNLNGGHLPKVELLLSAFAGGSSGYPVCWGEQYSIEAINKILEKNRSALLKNISGLINASSPKAFIPYAGYFTEAHFDDADIKRINRKNSPEDVKEFVKNINPDISFHIPSPGDYFDIGSNEGSEGIENFYNDNNSWDFSNELSYLISRERLEIDTIEKYFVDSGYRDNLTLHIREASDNFIEIKREYYFDFSSQRLSASNPSNKNDYLRMTVRRDVLWYVIKNKLSWDEISIGFNARWLRNPDVYNFSFDQHFQNYTNY